MKTKQTIINLFAFILFLQVNNALAQSINLRRQTTGIAGSSENIILGGNQFLVQQSIGQASAIGGASNNSAELKQGFIQPYHLQVKYSESTPLSISIFPNPFHSDLTIQFEEEINSDLIIWIVDPLGREVFYQKYAPAQMLRLALNYLNPGQYIIHIQAQNKLFTAQIQNL